MQFDTYHAARMELDLMDEFERSLPYVRHVQFADFPAVTSRARARCHLPSC